MPTENNTYMTALTAYIRENFVCGSDLDGDDEFIICDGRSAGRNTMTNPYLQPKIGPYITKVIFNDPATIVYWSDCSKTVVKCGEGDTFDPEKGLVMAMVKKALGNKGTYYNEIKKWLPND